MKKSRCLLLIISLVLPVSLAGNTWHVSVNGSDTGDGSSDHPFATISKAAGLAIAGDTVLIHGGVYRERVSPANGGISPLRRIVYMAAPGEEVWLKGSEVVDYWEKGKNGLWQAEIPNALFGDFNPFAIRLYGDWLRQGKALHLGEVYVDGNTWIEATSEEELLNTQNTWKAEVEDEKTVIRIHADEFRPDESLVEINVRPTCFYPKTTGINYITVRGLHIAQAATQWSPPTGEQTGMIGPNWSKGWVIEECEISRSKCVGICLGKTRASGHNMWSLYHGTFGYNKSGFTREIEAVFKACELGWSKENVGSHLIQNNRIFECGQAGIVGHMGAAFSVIRNNEIYHINRNPQITGAETAGIKLHAAIDVILEHNCITNTTMGIWLDWQAQGTHVRGNVISRSEKQDLFIEVSHGPTLVYNNILLSDLNLLINAQGIAYFNNLLSGRVRIRTSQERYTPYHFPHSTTVKGLFNNTGGDVRFYNNIFLANGTENGRTNGLAAYDRYPVYSEHLGDTLRGTPDYLRFLFPVWTQGNVYFKNGHPYAGETGFLRVPAEAVAQLEKREDGYYLKLTVQEEMVNQASTCAVYTDMLGQTFISETVFENPDGSPFLLNKDYYGNPRNTKKPMPGPLEKLSGTEVKVF